LPGTSAPVERVFSIMGNIWSAERSRLLVSTVKHLLNVNIIQNFHVVNFMMLLKQASHFWKKSCLLKSTTDSVN
jgi:hypothetical protein